MLPIVIYCVGVTYIFVSKCMIIIVLQYGRENLEKQSKKKIKRIEETDSEADDVDELNLVTELDTVSQSVTDTLQSVPLNTNGSISRSNSTDSLSNGNMDKKIQNGAPPLISRQDLILVPDPDQNYNGINNVKAEGVSFF